MTKETMWKIYYTAVTVVGGILWLCLCIGIAFDAMNLAKYTFIPLAALLLSLFCSNIIQYIWRK